MKTAIALVALFSLLTASGVQAERIAQSGSFVVDLDQIERPPSDDPFPIRANILENSGFETGALPPWTTNNWTVTNADAHSGSYCAQDVGNYWIRQDFDPISVDDILSIGLWSKQPEAAIQAIDFYYSDVDYDEFIIYPTATWGFFDVTSELRPVGALQAIRIWGYVGGGPDEDLTRIDDIVIDSDIPTPAQGTTWGQVKSIYR